MNLLFEGIINHLDSNWIDILSYFNSDSTIYIYKRKNNWASPAGKCIVIINWKRNIVTFKDDIFRNTWRFKINKDSTLCLYKGISCIKEHHNYNLMCWIDCEITLENVIKDKINDILLDNIS